MYPVLWHIIKQYLWGEWNVESMLVIENVLLHQKNVFLTGEAGTGKTFLTKYIIELLKEQQINVEVTAMSGIASVHLGGRTLHSAFHLGLKPDLQNPNSFFSHMKTKDKKKWQQTQVLVIDEIGTMSASLFEFLHTVSHLARQDKKDMREERKNINSKKRKRIEINEPKNINWVWGGIQLIVVGDFFQLAPIFDSQDKKKRWLFQSPLFATAFSGIQGKLHELTQIQRQKDPTFQHLLRHIRYGVVNDFVWQELRKLQNNNNNSNDIVPTKLFPRKADVAITNRQQLEKLNEPIEHVYHANVHGPFGKELLKNSGFENVLYLCKGAQVIHLINDPIKNIWNGSRGIVIDFDPLTNDPIIKLVDNRTFTIGKHHCNNNDNNKKKSRKRIENFSYVEQIPLALAWALSIHKSQSLTIDLLELSLKKAFDPSHLYVGLSRAKDPNYLCISDLPPLLGISPNPRVLEFAQKWLKKPSLLTF